MDRFVDQFQIDISIKDQSYRFRIDPRNMNIVLDSYPSVSYKFNGKVEKFVVSNTILRFSQKQRLLQKKL